MGVSHCWYLTRIKLWPFAETVPACRKRTALSRLWGLGSRAWACMHVPLIQYIVALVYYGFHKFLILSERAMNGFGCACMGIMCASCWGAPLQDETRGFFCSSRSG